MLEFPDCANGQASGLRALTTRKPIPMLTVRGTGSGAGASLVVAGLAHGLGQYYRTLLLDHHSGPGSLASIMGLRVRFDGRSVVNGEVPWTGVRVPVAAHVDYVGFGRGSVERAATRHWRALEALMRQYDLVLVDGGSQVPCPVFGGTLPLTLLVADGARPVGCLDAGVTPVPVGPLGLVINRVGPATDCHQIRERVRRRVGERNEIMDFGGLPLAQPGGSDRQWRRDLPSLSLLDALNRLPEAVQAWLTARMMEVPTGCSSKGWACWPELCQA